MDIERLLLSKTAQTGRVNQLLSAGINETHFNDDTAVEIFSFLCEHSRRYRQSPSFNTVKEKFPNYLFEISDEAYDYLLDNFKRLVKRRFAIQAVRDIAVAIDENDESVSIDSLFLEKSRELAILVPEATVGRFSEIDKRIDEYVATDPNDLTGIKMGIPDFDNLTLGIQPHEYVTISGYLGTGKSTLAQWILFNAWTQGKTGMLISLEMEKKALFRKWDTMITNFEYHNLKSHNLSEKELATWRARAELVKQHKNDILAFDDIRNFGVDRAYAEISRWKPDIVCIDYLTLMSTPSSAGRQSWEKVQYLTNNLKQISRTLKVPIIGLAQTNRAGFREGATTENVGSGISIMQDSDLVLGLWCDEEMKKNNQMEVRLLKNRDGMQTDTKLYWDMKRMDFRSPYSVAQAFTRREVA